MPPRLPELVGRLMIDPEFLAELQRAPESVLTQYELTDEERAAVRQAVERLGDTPPNRRAHALRTVLLKRVAT
ncbi:MAG: hypothetical protein FJZ38_22450 [Candidatus Rokubacteria bacterium]|nr:hypothetical protein [Candidatus Rokubacteria bacterium]